MKKENSSYLEQLQSFVDTRKQLIDEQTRATRETINEYSSIVSDNVHKVSDPTMKVAQDVISFVHKSDSDEGTLLRTHFSSVRNSVNEQLSYVQTKREEVNKSIEQTMAPVKENYEIASDKAQKFNAFRKRHPEALYLGTAVVVGLPSLLLRGKWGMARNVAIGSAAVGGITYSIDNKPWNRLFEN